MIDRMFIPVPGVTSLRTTGTSSAARQQGRRSRLTRRALGRSLVATQEFADDFNRPDSAALGTSSSGIAWGAEYSNTFVITSNAAVPENDSACAVFTPELSSGDQWAQATVSSVPQVSSFVGPIVRGPQTIGTNGTGTGAFLVATVSGASLSTYAIRAKAESSTTLTLGASAAGPTIAAGDVIRIEVIGTTCTLVHNGTTRVQWTAVTVAATQRRAGFYSDLAPSAVTFGAYDNFSAGVFT